VTATQPLLRLYRIGEHQLASRVVMAPLKRCRATNPDLLPTDLHAQCHPPSAPGGIALSVFLRRHSDAGLRESPRQLSTRPPK
jgi:N-ethylmaleimide reductase